LAELLFKGVIVYIDDFILYAETLEELYQLTLQVLEILRKAGLYLKASKCLFGVQEISFLGFVISHNGVSADPTYVQGITSFPVPRNLKQSRRFIGMASYYRRFNPNFSLIARPVNDLTKKDVTFAWGDRENKAFETLKSLMSSTPVLAHFQPGAETIIQTDASNFGWGFIISQIDPSTKLEHPIAIESGSFKAAELNYTVTEKEFYAIVMAFKRKRHILLQVEATILTDHLNLTYWTEPRQLNPRQARWADLLSGFTFKIIYRPGPKAVYPDALSRRPDYGNERPEQEFIQALPSIDDQGQTSSTISHLLHAMVKTYSELEGGAEEPSKDDNLVDVGDIREGLKEDKELEQVRIELDAVVKSGDPPLPVLSSRLAGFSRRLGFDSPSIVYDSRGLLRIDNKIYVPNIESLRTTLLRSHHDSILAGHQGVLKTLELLQRNYCWLGLHRDVDQYVRGCAICQQTKSLRQKPQGYLQSLEIPNGPWSSISMDFIEELPESSGFNSILVVVDRLTKWAIFIPTSTRLNTAGLVDLVINNVISQHGIPTSIVSDRGSKFTSGLWAAMCKALGVRINLSTAFHPQTDGQTER